ncbi:hypothetical protein BC834DRAFT_849161 [Gloeopeniophorella convolvens]|nr:hypothetical protein BC834DRAFT_849161 [Gloeopeniophorella convolvens]
MMVVARPFFSNAPRPVLPLFPRPRPTAHLAPLTASEPPSAHLISTPLRQRHVLLEISPTDHVSYLCWPSPNRDRAIHLLENLTMPLDELTSDVLVGYAVDPERTYAHVHVKSTGDDGLRLVFEWDDQENWKYHDANVMPFPHGTHSSLDDAIAGPETITVPVPQLGATEIDESGGGDDDDDDYWNSYGADDDTDVPPLPAASKDETDASEDAYWAQYASVQGSADSTIPSPVHKTGRKLQPAPVAQYLSQEGTVPYSMADVRSRVRDRKAPPSPDTLTRRLTALSPRAVVESPQLLSAPLLGASPDTGADEDLPGVTDDDSEAPSSLPDDQFWEEKLPIGQPAQQTAAPKHPLAESADASPREQARSHDDSQAVQAAVRGLFTLWKATRQTSDTTPAGHALADELDRADFLQFVGSAIAAAE